MILPVINLFRTKNEAFYFKNSQNTTQYIFGGIHLLPNNTTSYVQVTNTPTGIHLEDWTVKAISIDDKRSVDITPSFNVIELTNSDNGDPQVIWQLANIPADFGAQLAYLEVSQLVGETFYSKPFHLSKVYADKTTQFHYRYKKTETYQSIGFRTWFNQPDEKIELTSYYETSTGHTVTQSVKVNKIESYLTEPMAFHELSLLSMILRSPYLYVNKIRASLFEAIDLPQKKGNENFGQFSYNLSPKESDILNI